MPEPPRRTPIPGTQESAGAHQPTARQCALLAILAAAPGATVQQVRAELLVAAASAGVARRMAALAARGWAEGRADGTGSRAPKRWWLTAAGRAALHGAVLPPARYRPRTPAPISPDEWAVLGYLARHPDSPTATIWQALHANRSRTATAARLTRCERLGWVTSRRSGRGQSVQIWNLTAVGQAQLDAAQLSGETL